MSGEPERYDVVIVGGGHNGLVAATLLARAGRRVVVLERLEHLGGAAVSEAPFPGVDVRLSRYSYLVSLFPRELLTELDVRIELRRRRVAAYPLNDAPEVYALTERVARAVAPTLLEPLRSRDEMRALVGDEHAWEALFERPLSELLERMVPDDLTRGIVATDALIGTFASLEDPGLQQNRCFLYHVIGNGTGDWDIPVGGMGALTEGLEAAAGRRARSCALASRSPPWMLTAGRCGPGRDGGRRARSRTTSARQRRAGGAGAAARRPAA